MLDLTFDVTSGVTESYGESIGIEVWGEGMTHHAALVACAVAIVLARRLDASTSDADAATDLAVELTRT
ncbi:hypothetical protein BHM03_00040892 [Ensete ventricosum]|nr:hypothetical protein BHM03_00040892 [Ensete ventricosum]